MAILEVAQQEPVESAVEFLQRYGYKAVSDECWKTLHRDKSDAMIDIRINEHHEVDRHTVYSIECKFIWDGPRELEWRADRRLVQLRKHLHDPLRKQLGSAYSQVFNSSPFAHHGGPAGTTARLNRWFDALATSINSRACSPGTVSTLLQFLDAPEPPAAQPAASKRDSGLALFQARRKLSENLETLENAQESSHSLVKNKSALTLAVDRLEDGRYKLHGIHEDSVLKIGLSCLEARWCTGNALLELPLHEDGKSRLLKGMLIIGLLRQERDLKSMPMGDVAAAQGDLKCLSLCQLLRIRVWLLDYEPQRQANTVVAQGGNAHAAFMASLDSLLFLKLGSRASTDLTSGAGATEPQQLHRLGVELVCVVAAAQSTLAEAMGPVRWWAWWLEGRRVFFDVESFALGSTFPGDEGVVQVEEKTKVDTRMDGCRRAFEWNVAHVHEESLLRATRFGAECAEQ